MPVVKVRLSRLSDSFSNISLDKVIEQLPYIGLDIEGIDKESDIIRLEFNPNRPDFASEHGILRALNGLFEIEIGLPKIESIKGSNYVIDVDETVTKIRPVIYGFVAKRNYSINSYEISQLISMQEDLHNGIGRKRKKSSIGLHDLDSIIFPLNYTTVQRNFSFKPLDKQNEFTIDNILTTLDVGKNYGYIVNAFDRFPLLFDSEKKVLSFPPIINGDISKINPHTKNLFVEVTSTIDKSAQEIISLLSFELYDMGFKLFTSRINNKFNNSMEIPNLDPSKITVESNYINKILGLDLTDAQIIKCLEKSRCSGKVFSNGIECYIPRYRVDIFSPVDISEEVAIGYGIYKFDTLNPSLYLSGKKHIHSIIFNNIREILIGLGFIEIINTNIISQKMLDNFFLHEIDQNTVSISNSQNNEFETLRNSIIPSMMITLSKNIHEKYPQKLFEIGKIFHIKNSNIVEEWYLGIVIAHNNTDYSEIKSVLESLIKYCFNKEVKTPHFDWDYYLEGHSAKILLNELEIGNIGEIHPLVLEKFKLRTLVTSFQINLNRLMELFDINKLRHI